MPLSSLPLGRPDRRTPRREQYQGGEEEREGAAHRPTLTHPSHDEAQRTP
ncbi:hypothetical protein [Streptomyces aureoverticillatus]|nr:hypothetical protein [Streptomyces aureoverticillatus]QIB49557.1 hypothetical protein G3H79_41055 [Streptomyces aureoverticillatus]